MRHGAVLAIGLAAGLLSCSDPLVPTADLHGTWSSGRMTMQPRGSWEVVLTFSPDGRFSQTVSNYGVYAGTSSNELVAATVITGSYSFVDDRLEVHPLTHTWMDTFYDEPGPHNGEPPASLFTDCRYRIMGPVLTLQYTTYPADAPVETTATFARVR
jgi:hypothetical protein